MVKIVVVLKTVSHILIDSDHHSLKRTDRWYSSTDKYAYFGLGSETRQQCPHSRVVGDRSRGKGIVYLAGCEQWPHSRAGEVANSWHIKVTLELLMVKSPQVCSGAIADVLSWARQIPGQLSFVQTSDTAEAMHTLRYKAKRLDRFGWSIWARVPDSCGHNNKVKKLLQFLTRRRGNYMIYLDNLQTALDTCSVPKCAWTGSGFNMLSNWHPSAVYRVVPRGLMRSGVGHCGQGLTILEGHSILTFLHRV